MFVEDEFVEDEFDSFGAREERAKVLGFIPQKENALNHLLPYADELDAESNTLFSQIKTNLAKAVMLREMKPGCGIWSARLIKYLSIYGLKFSKKDHVDLLKIVYELMLIPDLEPNKVHKFVTLFVMLTKKRYLLTREDITIPWKPIFDLGKRLFDKSRINIGMYHYLKEPIKPDGENIPFLLNLLKQISPTTLLEVDLSAYVDNDELPTSLECSYKMLVKYAKPYFNDEATQEMVDYFTPYINPWGESFMVEQMMALLPVTLPPAKAAIGHELWLNRFMEYWKVCGNLTSNVSELMSLLASLAKHNPGTIDWSPHVPIMFVRFMHAISLPVTYKDVTCNKGYSIESRSMGMWIVWSISPDGVVLDHLKSFLIQTSSYLQSANLGRWTYKLRDLLKNLACSFHNRLKQERNIIYSSATTNKVPDHYKLREEDITSFVSMMTEACVLAVRCRCDVSVALSSLAEIKPALVLPPLINSLRLAFDSVTEPHKYVANVTALASVARPLLRGIDYPEGPAHAVPLLIACLPGLDPNDSRKTIATLQFIFVVSWLAPIINCSNASDYHDDLTEHEVRVCESTAACEDFVLLYIERLVSIVESSVHAHEPRHEAADAELGRSRIEFLLEATIYATTTAVLMQCSPKIFNEALSKFKRLALGTNYDPGVAGSLVSMILKVFARVNAEATLTSFVPLLCDEISDMLASDDVLLDETQPRELLYRLQLLSQVVECNGTALTKFVPRIIPILDRGLKLHAKDGHRRACAILAHIMVSLGSISLLECKSINKDYDSAPKDWLPIREWGKGCTLKEAKLKWYVPGEAEITCAQMIFDRYVKPELDRFNLWLRDERPMCPKRRLRGFVIILAATKCNTLFPVPIEEAVPLYQSLVPPTSYPLAGIRREVTLDGANLRLAMAKYLRAIQTKLLEEQSDDIRGFDALLQLWERMSGVRLSRSGPNLESRVRTFPSVQRALDGRGVTSRGRPRPMIADAALLQDEVRSDLHSDAGITPHGMQVLEALFQLSLHSYASVRRLAQVRLYWMLSENAYSYKLILPMLKEVFAKGGEGDEWHAKHKGALYVMLGPKTGPLVTKQDWEVVKESWSMIMEAPIKSEKLSILRLEAAFIEIIQRLFPAVNTTLTITKGCVEAANKLLPKELMADAEFLELLKASEEKEALISKANSQHYNELIDCLVRVARDPTTVWRRVQMVMSMLILCPNAQTPYPPQAIRLIVDSLIHDDALVRRWAIKLTHYVLKQKKIKVKKNIVNTYQLAGVPKPNPQIPGYRPDNEWVVWPENANDIDESNFDKPILRTCNVGFFSWPDEIEVAAPSNEQEFVNRKIEDMDESELYIYKKFTDDEFVNKFVRFLTIEDKKGRDKFSVFRFSMFRVLFRSYGYKVAERFLKHALRHASLQNDASQRFASEVAAAGLRSARYWDKETATKIYVEVADIILTGMSSVSPESLEDWGVGVASGFDNMDVRRAAPTLVRLLAKALHPTSTDTSFSVCARIYTLQGAIGSLSWRAAPLAAQVLRQLEELKYIEHPYQNIRENVGNMIMTVLDAPVFPGGDPGKAPKLEDLLENIKPKLAALYDEDGEIVVKSSAAATPVSCNSEQSAALSSSQDTEMRSVDTIVTVANITELTAHTPVQNEAQPRVGSEESDSKSIAVVDCPSKKFVDRLEPALELGADAAGGATTEHARAVNLITTVLRGCMGLLVRGTSGAIPSQYRLLRTACALSARGPSLQHDELARTADGFLSALASANHNSEELDIALDKLFEVAETKSWWARLSCVQFAQPLVFYSLPFIRRDGRAQRVEDFAFMLMKDPRIEVRRAASKLMTGLMHCKALPNEETTLKRFSKCCKSRDIIDKHRGVLGLCAYVSSSPYSLGDKLGQVLGELTKHSAAPAPLSSDIRATLSDFRRTHQDDWARHREGLTQDELDLLADLTAPPSYCA